MISVNSVVKLDHMQIKKLSKAADIALEKTAEALKTEVIQAQVIPFDRGTLQGEGYFVDYTDSGNGKVSLVHNTPYARRLYFHPEYNFQTTENLHAKGKWYEDWMLGGERENFTERAFAELYKRESGL